VLVARRWTSAPYREWRINLTRHIDSRIRSSRMTHRRLLLLSLLVALLAALVSLIPLAYVTPPDPTWVSGFFDNDDNDIGLFLITSSLAAADPFPLCRWTPLPVFGPAGALEHRDPVSSDYSSSADVRAPPLS
jgi:hypothetical protein